MNGFWVDRMLKVMMAAAIDQEVYRAYQIINVNNSSVAGRKETNCFNYKVPRQGFCHAQ